ncbi:hypothetical protein SAMN05444406_11360 [Caldicoprobacter faecalis]|uniref:Uncharacterized protein n=1 Tax=Caldicoprobacter faecalis TaxID=937334 RepID=A0A1I5W1C7_9FIRM|nr:hypothetical protein SAMN05444406_11360 [Caldicoprobacter faecalis]
MKKIFAILGIGDRIEEVFFAGFQCKEVRVDGVQDY